VSDIRGQLLFKEKCINLNTNCIQEEVSSMEEIKDLG